MISSGHIAALESVLAIGLIYASNKTSDTNAKYMLYASAAYLAYGAYLNTQGRVKLLPKVSQ